MCDQQSLRSACAYAQSDQCLCESLEYSMSVKLLTEHNLEFLSLKGGCTGSFDFTLVKMQHCWKFHVAAYTFICFCSLFSVSADDDNNFNDYVFHDYTIHNQNHDCRPHNWNIYTSTAWYVLKVVCFSRLLKCLRSLYGKQCGPRSECSL